MVQGFGPTPTRLKVPTGDLGSSQVGGGIGSFFARVEDESIRCSTQRNRDARVLREDLRSTIPPVKPSSETLLSLKRAWRGH